MDEIKRKPIIVRKPIITSYGRRNSDYNPEFLDKVTLLRKYTPLMQSIHKYFCSYVGILDQQADVDDLMSYIQLEFLNLAQKFDPKRGVDFPGYIKLNLRHKIYHYVTKSQKTQSYEQLIRQYGDEYPNSDVVPFDRPDESIQDDFDTVETLASIPWNQLEWIQRVIVLELLEQHKSLEQISEDYDIPLKDIKIRFDETCKLLENLNNPVAGTKENVKNEIIRDFNSSGFDTDTTVRV